MNATRGGRPIILLVALREIRTRLHSRVFRIGTIVMIALVAAGIVAATIIAGRNTTATHHVGFVGAAQALEPAFKAAATASGTQIVVRDVTDATAGAAQVTAGTLDVLVTGSPAAPVAQVKDTLPSEVESALDVAILEARLATAGLSPTAIASAVGGTHVEVQSLAPAAPVDPERAGKLVAALMVGFALYLALALYGTFVAQGVVEEKATRIVEILLATVRPSQLLAGKVIGIGLVGLLQLSIVGVATILMVQRTNVVSIPALSLIPILGYVLWFALGFLFYATAYAGVAATISRQEEVSGAIAPITIFLVASWALAYLVAADPAGALATVLSILPPFAPILMSVRMATGDAQPWQIGLALALEVVSIGGLTWLAGRIYANSILRLGKPVPLREAFRGR